MSGSGIEPATLRLLPGRFNQLSYVAAQSYQYLMHKQTFSDKSTHNGQQSFASHLHKIITIFKKSTQEFNVFHFKIAKHRSAAGGSVPRFPFLFCTIRSTTALLEEKRFLSLHVFE